jgi:plasmid replication initiation protein
MQKLQKSKTPKVYKNKKLNNANFGTYNLNDYQVFLQLVTKLGKVDELGTYKQPQTLERKHILTAKEFSQAFNVDINTTYRVLKTAGKKLARTAITLEKPDLFVTQEIPICSFAEYNNKEGSLTIEFNEHIMPYLAQVKQKFVLYNLKEIANFGSLYSTRLYELIQEFKDTGYIIKSVVQLREIFAVGKKFPDYNNFKRKTFAHAVDEINTQYEMNLSFTELKEGRRVVSIRFEFTPSHKAQGYNPATKQMVNVTVKPKRKPKQDDDNTPPPVHPDQQELPNIEEPKSTLQKVVEKMVNSKYAKKNYAPSVKKFEEDIVENGLTKENLKTYATERKEEIKQSLDEVKAIISAFMKKGLTESEAKIKAIELDLI